MELFADHYYVEKVRMGETDCFAPLLEKYSRSVFSLIVKIVGNREDAEELTQDVFMKAFRSLSSFREESSFSTWLYRIAYNTAISATRKKQVPSVALEEMAIREAGEDPEDAPDRETLLSRLEKALGLLPAEEHVMILLFYMQEKSVDEIAQISGMTTSNVKTKLFRTRKKLLNMMKEPDEKEHEYKYE